MDKTILITGAAGNLGSAVLKKFHQNAYRVAALDSPRSASKITETEDIKSFPVDLTNEKEVLGTIDDVHDLFPHIDIAVFTVGGFAMGNIESTKAAEIDKMYRLNFITAYNISRQVYLKMLEQEGGGQMVFIGSRPALQPDQAKDLLAYSLTKSLVFRLAEVINEEGGSKGVTASVVIPSIIDTPLNRVAMPNSDVNDWVTGAEIAENIYFLTTPAGKKLRESIIKVYGNS